MRPGDTETSEMVDPLVKWGIRQALSDSQENDEDNTPSGSSDEEVSATPQVQAKAITQGYPDGREDWCKENGLLRPDQVDWLCANEPSDKAGMVAGLIPKRAVSFLIGDSGLGKSPLAYQLGLSVAAGISFLGMKTQKGTVVYADYENGLEESHQLREQLIRFLDLPKPPENFLLWTPDHGNLAELNIERVCAGEPGLLILDSLRSHNPHFEKNDYTGQEMKHLNTVARKYGVAILVIHHTKKPGESGVAPLESEDTRLMLWLKQAAGHSSIINQSHTRIAADMPDGRSSERNARAALVLRWHRRVKGESGPVYLERICDGDGEPLGYKIITDIALLGNETQIAALKKLAEKFTFKDAMQAYDRSDDPTRKFLQKCISLGVVQQTGRGMYQRMAL